MKSSTLRQLAASTEFNAVSRRLITKAEHLDHQEFAKRHAEQLLVLARETANCRGELVIAAERLYGDHGSLIAGVHRDHFPDDVKTVLRDMAMKFGPMIEESLRLWTKVAGKRRRTWMRKKEQLNIVHY